METIDIGLEVKALTEEGTFEGYGSIFGNVDRVGDVVVAGAFTEGLARATKEKRSIKMLWNHDPDQPIGVWENLVEDQRGLKGLGRLVLEVPKAREVHALMKAGAIEGLSIGYRTTDDAIENGVRLLKKVDVFEISPVTFAANPKAKVTAFKSDEIADEIKKLSAGERLTEREFERLAKGLGLSNSQAERAARIHLKGPGEPVKAASEAQEFYRAMLGQ
jgi:hypothetical protein